ncbi:phosphopantothenate synthase [Sorangium cellulosum]|uniref:Coenzyme A biosynthesis bifunctional protein CoaBC n=1 Tax=Sorangium cellulosum TaxID=56 RepID=A0A2L0F714_SORCE|nr:bifunctional phosphopantothenoylcysteine decarboxylase/phosphopantothenate--cysteine ligase CoaBC [Sorangium cellulosum]AUX47229.1 phosphopantothenate synthase [Sorangium cellulosum]
MSGRTPSSPAPPPDAPAPPVAGARPPPAAGARPPPAAGARPPPAAGARPPPAAGARPTVALAVSGSIAAYKAAEVARLLIQGGARVLPIMTRAAQQFLGPMTLSGLCGEPVRDTMWDPGFAGELHVALAAEADLVLLVPATADVLARLAAGRADDLVTALALCASGPVLAAPAMHPRMWAHPATARNVAALEADGRVQLVGPVFGEVASGERGLGRMADPAAIAAAALSRLAPRDLAGLRVVVTAGPTLEDLDPVRFLGNRSTGKMGFAVAERAAARGAEVTLIAGPVSLSTPPGARRVDVRGALSMRGALWQALGEDLGAADVLIMTAAVSDYRPAEQHATKLKRTPDLTSLPLVPNPDLLAEVGAARAGLAGAARAGLAGAARAGLAGAEPAGGRRAPVLVGFAVETDTDERVVASARHKLAHKRVDLIVANHAADSFGRDDNRATLVTRDAADALGVLPKPVLADRILDRVLQLCSPCPR